jgi:sodium transport system ATP-binding protein
MIRVVDLRKQFKLNRRARKELGGGLRKYPTIDAVDGISFECFPGRVFGLLGPNGAGKTTALRLIATMLRPTAGSISVAGIDALEDPQDVRAHIGFLTGNTGLYDRLTATEMVKYHADLHCMDPVLFEERRRKLFSVLDMEEFANRRISRLSTGMRQKISIARTIIHDPDVLVFDEPTSGLDVMTSRSIVELIRSCREDGKTVLFSTHIMGEVPLLCDDIAVIHKGRLYFRGTKDEFEAGMTEPTYEDEFIKMVGGAEL